MLLKFLHRVVYIVWIVVVWLVILLPYLDHFLKPLVSVVWYKEIYRLSVHLQTIFFLLCTLNKIFRGQVDKYLCVSCAVLIHSDREGWTRIRSGRIPAQISFWEFDVLWPCFWNNYSKLDTISYFSLILFGLKAFIFLIILHCN